MIKHILLLLTSLSFLYGKPLIIDEHFISAMSGEYQTTFEDPNKSFRAEQILNNKELKPYSKLTSTYSKSAFWSTFEIVNNSAKPKTIVLRNLRAGIDYIDVYLYHNTVLSKTILLGDMRPQSDRAMLSTKSTFYLSLKPYETVHIVSRFDCFGSYDLQWELSTTQHYSYINGMELTFFGIFGGILIALIFYNLIMYATMKKPVFLAYIVHAAFLLWFQYAYMGILYFMNIGIDLLSITLSTWFAPHFMLSALGIFIILFFQFHHTHRFITFILKCLILINLVWSIIFLYAYNHLNILLYTNYSILSTFVTMLFYFWIGIYAVYKHYTGGWYYLIGQGTYLITLIYLGTILSGQTPTGYTTALVPISTIIEIFTFSLALSVWIKQLQIDKDKANKLLIDEARFTTIGKSIGMAVHQWKDPLSQMGSHILYLKAKEYQGESYSTDVTLHIDAMSDLIEHMKNTVNDVYESCTDLTSSSPFNVHDSILLAHRFLKDRLTLSNIVFIVDSPEFLTAKGSKNALANVLTALIDNSITQCESNNTLSPTIWILVTTEKKSISIRVEDNGGGISIFPIADIFDFDKSTKGSSGTGMGLALVKLLVEKRLNGRITASNTDQGASFKITIPLYITGTGN